jgi:hypothetical protein
VLLLNFLITSHSAYLLRRRWPSALRTALVEFRLPCLPRPGLFVPGIRLRFSLVVDVSIDPDFVTKVLHASLARIKLRRVLPAVGNRGPGAWLSTRVLELNVLRQQDVRDLGSGRQGLDGGFVVAVVGRPPFLCSDHRAGESDS